MNGPVIGVLSPYLAGPYHGAVVSAILRAASNAGAGVAAVQTAGPGRRFHHNGTQDMVGRVAWGRVAGFVTIANSVPVGYLKEFRATTGKPVVAIGHEEAGFSCRVGHDRQPGRRGTGRRAPPRPRPHPDRLRRLPGTVRHPRTPPVLPEHPAAPMASSPVPSSSSRRPTASSRAAGARPRRCWRPASRPRPWWRPPTSTPSA